MALNCNACVNLEEDSPDFVQNGVTETVCTSLKNDTGFTPSTGNNDFTDLTNANDCLVGNMEEEIEAYEVCDWKDYMSKFVPNVYNVLAGIICALGGLWSKIHSIDTQITNMATEIKNLWNRLTVVSYVGILTLYTNKQVLSSGSGNQRPAFNANTRQGNVPSSVLSVSNDYTGITIKNTLGVPLLVDTTFNCSIRTEQNFACCFTVITKDGNRVGQTPFITPTTYDQQVRAESFILASGATAVMRYYFRIGDKNEWFQSEFGYRSGGSGNPQCCLEPNDPSDPENQRSYFSVKVTSIVDNS